MAEEQLRLKRLVVRNIKGIEYAEVIPKGSLTVIIGANREGKTSLKHALASIPEGGWQPNLIRRGQEKGSVELELSDGTVIRRVTTLSGYQLNVLRPDGTVGKKPKEYVDALFEAFAYDPLRFCREDKARERVEYLMRTMPIRFESAEVSAATGDSHYQEGTGSWTGPWNLDAFDQLTDRVAEERRAAHSRITELTKSAANLRPLVKDGPAGERRDWGAEVARLKTDLAALSDDVSTENAQVREQAKCARETAQTQFQYAEDRLREEFEAKLAKVRSDKQTRLETINKAESAAIEAVSERKAEQRTELAGRLAAAEENARQDASLDGIRAHLAEVETELERKLEEHKGLNEQVAGLQRLRAAKLESLKIPGLVVKGQEVFYNNTPFDDLSGAEKFMLAVEIGTLLPGRLPLVVCDGWEQLDKNSKKEFREAAEASGWQFIVMCVDPDAESIRSEPEGALLLA